MNAGPAPAMDAIDRRDLTRAPLAAPFAALYRMVRGPGAATIRRLAVRSILRLERGPLRSATLRDLMAAVHGVRAGAYAYGCFDPTCFPAGVTVGRWASIGPGVRVFRRGHPLDHLSLSPFFYNPGLGVVDRDHLDDPPLTIGEDVWIGANALILPGCRTIGRGAVIAAGAVVTRDVPPYAVAGGNPARVLKMRFDPVTVDAIEAGGWWRLPVEAVARHRAAMCGPVTPDHPLLAPARAADGATDVAAGVLEPAA